MPGKLHLLLLRQIEAEKNCIDLLYILKKLELSRALEQVKPLCDTLLSHVILYAYRITCESRVSQSVLSHPFVLL